MISRGDDYRDSTVDYEAMAVKRNAPRWIVALKTYRLSDYGFRCIITEAYRPLCKADDTMVYIVRCRFHY